MHEKEHTFIEMIQVNTVFTWDINGYRHAHVFLHIKENNVHQY